MSAPDRHADAHAPGRLAATPSRAHLAAVIPHRMKVGPIVGLLLALGFALAVTPVLRVDAWLATGGALEVRAGEPAPITVRVPPFAGSDQIGHRTGGTIIIARGAIATPAQEQLVAQVSAHGPHGLGGDLAYFAVVLVFAAIYTLQLRRSNQGRVLRTQLVLLSVLLAVAVAVKAAMLLTPLSVLAIPVALLAIVTTIAVDRATGLATGVLASLLCGLLVPFDIGVTAVLLVQALTAALLLPDRIRRRWRVVFFVGLLSAALSMLAYGVVHYLTRGSAPVDELGRLGRASWLAAGAGGLIAALAAVPLVPALQVALGDITEGKLVQLQDLSHPLLRQIAEKSPGTWQHSLAMANMAEIAANAIGANGRLVRVGAYFHDLGKSLQSKYFIENLESGEQSPHDRLPPEVSCDAIFAHVTEGIAVARRHRLPERVIDFMHMHHGDGVLEYFWAKCNETGNPKGLTVNDFRYPGVPPQSRETAILAICDAVEAASRTLRKPDEKAISSLVQRIVYGKLHLGQLDQSGLSMADLRKISDSLRETIKHAHHGRIEYPWQRAEREAADQATPATVLARPPAAAGSADDGPRESITQRLMDEPRLDSLDAPRPPWAAPRPPTAADVDARAEAQRRDDANPAEAATGPVSTDPLDLAGAGDAATMSLRQPPSADAPAGAPRHDAAAPPAADADAQRRDASEQADTDAMPVAFPPDEDVEVIALAPSDRVGAAIAQITAPHDDEPAVAAAAAPPVTDDAVPEAAEATPSRAATSPWASNLSARLDALMDDEEPSRPEVAAAIAQAPPPTATDDEVAIVDEAAIDAEIPATPSAAVVTVMPRSRSERVGSFADVAIEALADAHLGVPGVITGGDTARRTPPPPPRARRPFTTLEVDGDDVEASIEVSPSMRSTGGAIVGPPPATRAAPGLEPASVPRATTATSDEDDDPEITVSASAPRSMLPPRARTHNKPRE